MDCDKPKKYISEIELSDILGITKNEAKKIMMSMYTIKIGKKQFIAKDMLENYISKNGVNAVSKIHNGQ